MRFFEVVRSVDWILYGAAILLVLLGLAVLFTATYASATGLTTGRFFRQLIAATIALGLSLLVARIPYHQVRRYAIPIYGLGLVGLMIVAGAARVIRGTASRLDVAGIQVQPSEFMKVALVIVLAWLFARRVTVSKVTLGQSLLLLGVPIGFIILEPDLGMATLLVGLWGVVVVFMGLSWKFIAASAMVGLLLFGAAWQWQLAEYQRERLLIFIDPTRDPLGAGYNVLQSIVAFGSGRLLGRGLGHGPQSQLQFLPEQHTDFILASIGEELGFVGVMIVMLLYTIIFWRILRVAEQTRDLFGQLLCVGTFVVILIGFMVSAGMNMGLLPVTGIPLPFVSYGGSNLVTTFLLLGLVQSVRVYSRWVQAHPTEIDYLT